MFYGTIDLKLAQMQLSSAACQLREGRVKVEILKKALQIPQGKISFLITVIGILLSYPVIKFFGDSKYGLFIVLIISVVTAESARTLGLIMVKIRDSQDKS